MQRDRWLTILAVLGTTALVGCEKKDSPATEVPAAAADNDGEHSCGEGGCGGAKHDDADDTEAATDAGAGATDAGAPSDAAAGAPTSETDAATETAAVTEAPAKPKPKAKPKKKKAKGSAEQACGEGTCA